MAEPMDEDRLKALLANYIRGALGYDADAL